MAKRKITVMLCAALGLSSLAPVQQGATLLAVGGAALWAGPAMAQQTVIPGVGTVVKKKPGDATMIASAGPNGETRLTGLEPGEYGVRVFEGADETTMRVGRDGRLAFVARESINRPDPRATDPRARRALPVVRRWAEQIPFGEEGGSGTIISLAANRIIDANTASGEQLTQDTGINREAVAAIIGERTRNGPFVDLVDFARRVCPQAAIDFQDASVRFGSNTLLVFRGGDPKQAGFKCARGTGEMELFARRQTYVGHVTLLR